MRIYFVNFTRVRGHHCETPWCIIALCSLLREKVSRKSRDKFYLRAWVNLSRIPLTGRDHRTKDSSPSWRFQIYTFTAFVYSSLALDLLSVVSQANRGKVYYCTDKKEIREKRRKESPVLGQANQFYFRDTILICMIYVSMIINIITGTSSPSLILSIFFF